MRKRKLERRLVEERDDPEKRLQDHGRGEHERRARTCARRHRIGCVQERQGAEPIGHHAVIKLNGERILEEVAPPRRVEPQPRRVRHEVAIDERPGVVDQTGAQPRHQRSEIDLYERERDERRRRDPNAPRRLLRVAAGPLRGPHQRGQDQAGKEEMRRQPILRDLGAVGEPRGDHPPADCPLQRAEAED